LKSIEHTDWVRKVQANSAYFPDLMTEEGYVYRRSEHLTGEQTHDEYARKLWIPKQLVQEVISQAHKSPLASYGGMHKTIERVRRYYFWPELVSNIKSYINVCQVCKSITSPNSVLRLPMGKAERLNEFFSACL
jgi:hypothetical protein